MSVEEVEQYEADAELALYKEYRDVLPMFRYVVETDKRVYLANEVTVEERGGEGEPYLELRLKDAWVWDLHRQTRFTNEVRVVTFHDVAIEDRRGEDPDGAPAR